MNYQPSFWENNKNYIVLTIFCVLLAVTLAVMLLQSDHDRQQARLIAEKKVKEAELKKALEKADKDAFTGLYNKAATQELIQKKLAMLSGSEKAALAIIDMDKFKHINDTLGHLEGDRVILQFAGLLKEFFRAEDLLGRVGGDEFIVFMSGLTQDGIAYERTNKFVNFINRKYCSGELLVTISVGVAIASVATKSFEELYAKADEAMYRDKSQAKNPCDGKGCVRQGR